MPSAFTQLKKRLNILSNCIGLLYLEMNLETIEILNNSGAFVCTDVSLKFAGDVLLH